jgi:anti-sigma regulatory factor (Ser/Thr protein kinase)
MERITLPREAATPRRARHYLAPRLDRLGMPSAAAAELLIAVGEAVANAVLYGAPAALPFPPASGDTDVVLIELMTRGDRVAVAVTNRSAHWRVPPAALPDDPLASRGRGLYLMRRFADSVRIAQNRRGTTVYLIRRLRPDAAPRDATPPPRPGATPPVRRRAG